MKHYKTIPLSEAISKRQERIAMLCWKVFEQSEDGKELMQLLKEEYLMQPVAGVRMKNIYGEHYVGIREGQNELVRDLNNLAVNFKRIEADYEAAK